MGIRDLRCGPIGAKEHARGHIAFPKRHSFAEDTNIEAFHILQVAGCRKTVRAGAKNYDVTIFHG